MAGSFQMSITFLFAPNTIIRSAQVNNNFVIDVRDKYNAHDAAGSGVHDVVGHLVGTTDAQDLSNKTFLDNIVWKSGTAFTGILDHANTANRTYTYPNVSGNVPSLPTSATTETGSDAIVRATSPTIAAPTLTGTVNLNSNTGFNVFSDVGVTLKFKINGATGDFGSAGKFFVGDPSLLGTTYINLSAANQISNFTGGTDGLAINTTVVSVGGGRNLQVQAGQRFYIDAINLAGGDTFVKETAANTWGFTAGGTETFKIGSSFVSAISSDFSVDNNKYIYADGIAGNTRARAVGGWRFDAGGANEVFVINSTAVGIFNVSPILVYGGGLQCVIGAGENVDRGIGIYTSNSKTGNLLFTDTAAGAGGMIQYDHSTNRMLFYFNDNLITEKVRFQDPSAGTDTALWIQTNTGGLQKVDLGAADSAGAGFRLLRVAN